MSGLITALETVSQGARELDAYIWAEVNNSDLRWSDNKLLLARSRTEPNDECLVGYSYHSKFGIAGGMEAAVPKYTISIDDALKLIPKSYEYSIQRYEMVSGEWVTEVKIGKRVFGPHADVIRCTNESTCLAICIAALKARAIASD